MSTGSSDDILLLLQKINEGDEEAFNKVFKQYRNKLFTYLLKIVKSAETSEEIVLDVFIRIWHGREYITEIKNFDSFIFRVAHNKAIDFLRTLKTDRQLQYKTWINLQEPASSDSADKSLHYKNTEAIIEKAIDGLSPQRQKVFCLHYNGSTNAEIADKMGISKNTVRNHLAASMEFIRSILTKTISLFILVHLSGV